MIGYKIKFARNEKQATAWVNKWTEQGYSLVKNQPITLVSQDERGAKRRSVLFLLMEDAAEADATGSSL